LTYVYESVDPPHNLAKRTCTRIWEHIDRIEQKEKYFPEMPLGSVISMTIPASRSDNDLVAVNRSTVNHSVVNRSVTEHSKDNNCLDVSEVLEKILTVSACQPPIPATSEHSNSKRLIRRFPRSRKHSEVSPEKPVKKNRRWFDFSISIAVGVLIAVIAFPVINYVKNQTQNYLTQSKIHEINKSIDHYTQLQGKPESPTPIDNSSPINLTQSGWQELKPAQFPEMLTETPNHSSFNSSPVKSIPIDVSLFQSTPSLLKSVSQNSKPVVSSDSSNRDIILGQTGNNYSATEFFPLDPHEFIDQTLISEVNQIVPNSDGTTVQTAYGQNVLFQNGRIFFRVLPVFTPKE
jgi:cell division protein FtsL